MESQTSTFFVLKKQVQQAGSFSSLHKYIGYYGLNFPDCKHHFSTFFSQGFELSAHLLVPKRKECKGIVVFMHGYLDHCGLSGKLFNFLLSNDYAVACYDMPGHGLSGGEKVTIENFGIYGKILNDFTRFLNEHLVGPFFIVAHSAGCSGTYDYLVTLDRDFFRRVIFLAPLIRSYHWYWSQTGLLFYRLLNRDIPRVFRKNTSDRSFMTFVLNDPLQSKVVPLKWALALKRWNRDIISYPYLEREIFLIQGKRDRVVDWKHNVGFLRKKANIKTFFIDEANHSLLNEKHLIREKVFQIIYDCLKK